ncbi:MAG TPA: ribonuclease H-like domain-containing protein [Thermoanaerobaculia bacterium]|jgi:predicted PolB exonuclease-like 3'-5' exonuclease|nr:ribonuclease H-like domain-containing protein [Thermoanaerobaculia bacterium]
MKKLVIDIETVGTPWEELDAYVREYLIKGLNDGDAEETRRAGGLSPFRGRIIAIGVINIEDGRSCAMYEVPGQTQLAIEKAGQRTYMSGSEKQILEKFWEFFEGDSRFITFNGRQFDGPFLMIRSAINGIVPKRDLVGYRYGYHPNCDLREALNFFGTTNARQFKFNLDLACKVFGVETSKGEGLDGRSVETWYRAGRHREIADYCLDDVRATCELYEKVAPSLLIFNKEFREAEERSRRRYPLIDDVAPLLPSSEASFIESVTQSSLELMPALDATPEEAAAVSSMTRAIVLEKLVQKSEAEEDIPTGI